MAMTVMMMMLFHHILLGLGLPQQIQTLSHLRIHLQDTLLSRAPGSTMDHWALEALTQGPAYSHGWRLATPTASCQKAC